MQKICNKSPQCYQSSEWVYRAMGNAFSQKNLYSINAKVLLYDDTYRH